MPFEQNPERALGVIFDHDAIPDEQDSRPSSVPQGTKLTVMLGGHWWDGWDTYPSTSEGLELATSIVKRHLGIDIEPQAHLVNLHKNCIPQYTVGYQDRMCRLDEKIKREFGGRWRVVGSAYSGVGVNDCVKGAWYLAHTLREEGWRNGETGLERWSDQEWFVGPSAAESAFGQGGGTGGGTGGGIGGVPGQ